MRSVAFDGELISNASRKKPSTESATFFTDSCVIPSPSAMPWAVPAGIWPPISQEASYTSGWASSSCSTMPSVNRPALPITALDAVDVASSHWVASWLNLPDESSRSCCTMGAYSTPMSAMCLM